MPRTTPLAVIHHEHPRLAASDSSFAARCPGESPIACFRYYSLDSQALPSCLPTTPPRKYTTPSVSKCRILQGTYLATPWISSPSGKMQSNGCLFLSPTWVPCFPEQHVDNRRFITIMKCSLLGCWRTREIKATLEALF